MEPPDTIDDNSNDSDKAVYLELDDDPSSYHSEDSRSHDESNISFIQDEGSNDGTMSPVQVDKQEENIVSENPGKIIKSISCEVCNLSFRTREQIDNHFEEHDSETCKQCEICSNILNTNLLDDHLLIHKKAYEYRLNTKYRKVKCGICYKYISKNYLKVHLKHHETDEDRYTQCQICDKKVVITYLDQHYKRVHKNNLPQNISQRCPICEKFYKVTKYKEHLASHGRLLKKYVCDQCGKEFKYPSAFKTHILTHRGDLKYKCAYCDYRGLHKGLLKIHIRTHTKEYAYKCSICEKTFITKSNLNIHMRVHETLKKFTCSECNKCFRTEKRMMKHYDLIHLNIRDRQCEVCGKAFGDNDGLLSHQKKIHNRQNVSDRVGRKPSYLQMQCNN